MSRDGRPPLIVEVASAVDAMIAVAGDLDASGHRVVLVGPTATTTAGIEDLAGLAWELRDAALSPLWRS